MRLAKCDRCKAELPDQEANEEFTTVSLQKIDGPRLVNYSVWELCPVCIKGLYNFISKV